MHVFLAADAGTLRERLTARPPLHPDASVHQAAISWTLSRVDTAVAAAASQPDGTVVLRSDRLTPAELADKVLAAADLDQVH